MSVKSVYSNTNVLMNKNVFLSEMLKQKGNTYNLTNWGIDLKRITRCKLALIFTSADHRQFLGLFWF